MKRLATAAVGVPFVVAGIFLLPTLPFLAILLVAFGWAAWELCRLMHRRVPTAPLWLLPVILPVTTFSTFWALVEPEAVDRGRLVLAGGLLVTFGVGALVLMARVRLEEAPETIGFLAFGIPYFSLPVASLAVLQRHDPWLVLLLVAIVWLGDTAAFYVGSSLGRHKMSPRVSPNKSWEGAVAGFVTALVATIAWCLIRRPEIEPGILAVAAATAVSAQLGDLLESVFKRSVRIKDSGNVLPGHGGILDRVDALLLAAPVFLTGLWILALPDLGF